MKTAIRAHEIYASEAEEGRARRTQSRHLQFVAARRSSTRRSGLLAGQVADAARFGFSNMLTVAESLLAEVYLRRGRPEDACAVSTEAVERLEESGQLALVTTEEILWRHGRSLEAAGRDGDAYLDRARAELRRKAGSLDEADRPRFLQATPVARDLSG